MNIYNRTGGTVTQVSLKNNKTKDQSSVDLIQDGVSICLSVSIQADISAGAPDLTLSYTDANASQWSQTLAVTGTAADVTLQKEGQVNGAPKD